MEGSIEVGSPGSTSRRKMPSSCLARLTPSHAAALKDLSSFPPMSKTMPTRSLPPDSSRLPRTLVHAGSASVAANKTIERYRFIRSPYLLYFTFVDTLFHLIVCFPESVAADQ